MDLVEPRWRTNSSFSPPLSRIWERGVQSDRILHGSQGVSVHGSLSTSSKGSRRSRIMGSDERYTNHHHHSVSDGVLSYSGSSPGNFPAGRWTSPVQKRDVGDFAHPSIGGSRLETTWLPHSAERRYTSRTFATSYNYGSPSSLPESGQSRSSAKQPLNFPNHNFPSRRSFMSKPVYPLMFHNPISSTNEHGFQETLTELQETTTSPDPTTNSRRDGFRWSSDSSYDMGFDRENLEVSDTMEVESPRSPACHMGDERCEVCGKFLWQKSPWSSRRIMRGGDLPVAGVLPCSHVFHADCLEQVTVKGGTHEPPCPVCMKIMGPVKEPASISEPLEMALRSVRRRGNMTVDSEENGGNVNGLNCVKNREMRIVKNRIGKHLSFKGKMAKDLFSKKLFKRAFSSSSSSKTAV